MFAIPLIAAGIIFTAGPLHIEGGAAAIQNKGVKVAAKTALNERQSYFSGSLVLDHTGDYGND